MLDRDIPAPELKNREYLDQKAKVIMRDRHLIAFTLQQLMSEYRDVDVEDFAERLSPVGDGPLAGVDPQSIQDGRLLSECDARFIIPEIGNSPRRMLDIEIQSGKSGTRNLVIRMFVNQAHSIAQQKTMLGINDPKKALGTVDIMVHIVSEKRYRNQVIDLAYRRPDGSMNYPGSEYSPRIFHLFLGDADKADRMVVRIYDILFISNLTEEREQMLKRLNIDVPIEYRQGAEFVEYSERVFQEGIRIGEEKGEKKGEKKGIVRSIAKLVNDGRPFDEAFDLLSEPGMDREEVRKEINQLNSAN